MLVLEAMSHLFFSLVLSSITACEHGSVDMTSAFAPSMKTAVKPARPQKTKENVITRGAETEWKHCQSVRSYRVWRRYRRVSAWLGFTGGLVSDVLMIVPARTDSDVKVLWTTPWHHHPCSKKRNDITTRISGKSLSDGPWNVSGPLDT